jgi:hypothetical protein
MEVRDSAMMDVVKAHKSNLAKKKKDSSHTWELKYRRKKDRLQTIKIPGKCVKSGGVIFPKSTNEEPLHVFEERITTEHELQIHLDRSGVFWATILRKPDISLFDPTNKDLRLLIRTFRAPLMSLSHSNPQLGQWKCLPENFSRTFPHAPHVRVVYSSVTATTFVPVSSALAISI